MIVRLWLPAQRLVQRHAAIATAVGVAVVGVLAWVARRRIPELPDHRLIVIAALIAMLVMTARRRQVWPLLVLAVALGVVTALALPGEPLEALAVQAVLGVAVALALPLATGLRDARGAGRLNWAIGRGSAYVVAGAHLAALGLFAGGGRLSAAIAVAALAIIVLGPAWARPRGDPGDESLRFLSRPERARPLLPWWVGALVLALAAGSAAWRGLPVGLAAATWWTLGLATALWAAATARLDRTVAAGLAQLAALAACAWLPGSNRPGDEGGSEFAVALALAQLVPLATTMTLEAQRGWHPALPAFIAMALALAFNGTPAQWPLVIAAGIGWLVIPGMTLPVRRGRPPGGEAIAGMVRAAGNLEVSWRCYWLGKLRWDGVYRRLAGDTRRWGKVLDAGCGPGLGLALCAARSDVDTYVGVDLDHDKLLVAACVLADSDASVRDRFSLAQAQLPLPHPWPLTFDTVLLIDVLHYWSEPAQRALLAQLCDALIPGGVLYLRDGVAAADGGTGAIGLGERFTTAIGLNPGTGLHFLTEERLRTLLADCGFTVQTVEAMGGANRLLVCVRDD